MQAVGEFVRACDGAEVCQLRTTEWARCVAGRLVRGGQNFGRMKSSGKNGNRQSWNLRGFHRNRCELRTIRTEFISKKSRTAEFPNQRIFFHNQVTFGVGFSWRLLWHGECVKRQEPGGRAYGIGSNRSLSFEKPTLRVKQASCSSRSTDSSTSMRWIFRHSVASKTRTISRA